MHVTELMDLPDTGGKRDEIGGHVDSLAQLSLVYPTFERQIECPDCGTAVGETDVYHVCADGGRFHNKGNPGEEGRPSQ